MSRFGLSLLMAFSLSAAPQAIEKAEDAVEKTAKKTAKVTETVAKDVVEGTKKVAKKTANVTEKMVTETADVTKAGAKKTAKVARTVGSETVDVTKAGAKKVADAVEPIETAEKKAMSAMSGKVNLNTATRTELIALPGIGEANADKIIKARPFATVADLSSKKIVQNHYYEKFKGLVTVK